jgi:hypothetical protein
MLHFGNIWLIAQEREYRAIELSEHLLALHAVYVDDIVRGFMQQPRVVPNSIADAIHSHCCSIGYQQHLYGSNFCSHANVNCMDLQVVRFVLTRHARRFDVGIHLVLSEANVQSIAKLLPNYLSHGLHSRLAYVKVTSNADIRSLQNQVKKRLPAIETRFFDSEK